MKFIDGILKPKTIPPTAVIRGGVLRVALGNTLIVSVVSDRYSLEETEIIITAFLKTNGTTLGD